ncbi:hypothetical protein Q765_18475 [Flavobacterium rivuli WB 3.3-2 = DSM 21788]|uniref:Plasmid stabilization protein n=1 Tax=Flavobacterium rivuli WB 3.3-2 = DSM 21788 TaxID=1121895 RepID=A0A0A2M073_9FLAO|nr:hypothetical protein Q765_18475 [Flavobacterium rivuli WB 3.3-2 = DSM 21788]
MVYKCSEINYLDILEQVYEKWNLKIMQLLESQVNDLLNKISIHNHICPVSKITDLHKCVVNEHISMIYKMKNNFIEIVALIFNQSNHQF